MSDGTGRPKALIFQQEHRGHYLYWVRLVLEAAVEEGLAPVVVLDRAAERSPEFGTYLEPWQGAAEFLFLDEVRPKSRWRLVARLPALLDGLVARTGAEHLLLPTADGTARALNLGRMLKRRAALDKVRNAALVMRCPAAYGEPDRRVPAWIERLSWSFSDWDAVLAIDPVVARWLAARRRGRSRVAMAPDPIDRFPPLPREEARASIGLGAGGRLVASLGMQGARKGVDLLVEAFASARLAEEDRLLLAGPGAGRFLRLAQERLGESAGARVVAVDRFLSHEELHRYASAADLVATLYRDASLPSGIAIRALAAERPVLAAAGGWFEPMVGAFELGSTCALGDPKDVAAALVAALDASSRYRPSEAARRLLAFQDPRQHVLAWRAAISGRDPESFAGEALSWEWVLSAVLDEGLRGALELR